MDAIEPTYDPRYLAGVVLFNRGDFFEAHEVWESLWMDETGPDKKFYQGLIQAAVALCHFCNGNGRGAVKLFKSSRDYMGRYGEQHHGLCQTSFWAQMQKCFADLLAMPDPTFALPIVEERIPTINLVPEPRDWPDPAMFLTDE